jgi:hypothetical protein
MTVVVVTDLRKATKNVATDAYVRKKWMEKEWREEKKRRYMYAEAMPTTASRRRSLGRNDREDVLVESREAASVHTNGSFVLHQGSRQAETKCRGKELTFSIS